MNRARLIFLACWICVLVAYLGAYARVRVHGADWSFHDGG